LVEWVVAPLLRAPDDVPFLVVAVAAVVLRGVAGRAFVPAGWQIVTGEFGVGLVLSRSSRFKCSVGNLRRRTVVAFVGKVHNAPFLLCLRAVGLQPLVEGAFAGDDDRCYAVRRGPVELRAIALGVARLVAATLPF